MKENNIYRLLWAACALLACLVGWRLANAMPRHPAEEAVRQELQAAAPTPAPPQEGQPEQPYLSPVDFGQLWQQNPEIAAWLDIPGTGISYPVLRSETDNSFYLNHDSAGQPYRGGALFVEDYNCRALTDPVTIIYGHRLGLSGLFFGALQRDYETRAGFEAHRTLTLYLPDRQEQYMVVAAVPYNSNHILYNYDFTVEREHYRFFDRAFAVHGISAQTDFENYPEFGEKVLILSTCTAGSRNGRYLVIAKEVAFT